MESKIDPETIKFRLQGLSWSPLATPWLVLGRLGALLDDDGKRSMALAIGDWSFSSVSKHEWL